MADPKTHVDKDYLKTLARGLELIRSFGNESPRMTLSEVARKNTMSRATARRFVLTLQTLGYIIKKDEFFQLTAKTLEIGHQYLANLDFIEVITPFMREASRKLYKACSASILHETDIVYVARIPSQHQVLSVSLNIGSRLPAYCTSMGRVLLGNLSEKELDDYFRAARLVSHTPRTVTDPKKLLRIIRQVKADGYCIVNQELEESLCSVSVPVRNFQGEILCAINVGMPVGQVNGEHILTEYLPVLREAASRAQQQL